MTVTVHWSRLGLGSLVAFLLGWWLFNLVGAILLAVVAMLLLGIITVDGRSVFSTGARTTKRPRS